MKQYSRFFLVIVWALLAVDCSSPSGDDEEFTSDDSGNIVTGESSSVLTHTFGTAGGTETVHAPGEPLDGLEISVPPNSYTSSVDMDVSYAPLLSHQLGEYFNPITPLIRITGTGGFSDSIMTISIPISIAADEFAMAYAYVEATGELEGLPLLDLSDTLITIGTRHFATSDIYSAPGKSELSHDIAYMNIVVSAIKTSVLADQGLISSGFRPGVDDWEFVNRGSYVSPGGHCAGQSMTALWYYQTIRTPQLFGLLDMEPGLSPDNPLGYKFASTIQEDQDFTGWVAAMKWVYHFDEVSFNAFATSILQTGQPQSVLIRNSAGHGGHAMIIYDVDYNGGILYVADPNYPGNKHYSTGQVSVRQIKFANGKFEPYSTGLRADQNAIDMDQIGYSGKSAFADWSQIASRWLEVQDGTIGNDRFPTLRCSVSVMGEGAHLPVGDTVRVENDSIWFFSKSNAVVDLGSFSYRGDVKILPAGWVKLNSGMDRIGHEILGKIGNKWEWVDFQYVTYYTSDLRIEPANVSGQLDSEFSFTAFSGMAFPARSRFEWDFDDGTDEVIIRNDSTVTHTYSDVGVYKVILQVYDDSNNKLFGEAHADVDVREGLVIDEIAPSNAETGDTVTINGIGFEEGEEESWVIFGGYTAEVIDWSPTQIRVVVPTSLVPGDVLVYVQVWHEMSNNISFTVDEENVLAIVQATNHFNPGFFADCQSNLGDDFGYMAYLQPELTDVVWDGVSFSVEKSETRTYGEGGESTETEALNGTVSWDGRKIVAMTYTRHVDASAPGGEYSQASFYRLDISVAVTDVSLEEVSIGNLHYAVRGPETQNHMTIQFNLVEQGSTPGDPVRTYQLASVNWDNPDEYPSYHVWFMGD